MLALRSFMFERVCRAQDHGPARAAVRRIFEELVDKRGMDPMAATDYLRHDRPLRAQLRGRVGLVVRPTSSTGPSPAIARRAAASSVAPIGTAMGAPCVLASLGTRDRGIRSGPAEPPWHASRTSRSSASRRRWRSSRSSRTSSVSVSRGARTRASVPSTPRGRRASPSRPARGTFKCFGCGEGGDAITFVEKTENLDFVGAIELLARRFGVELEYEEASPEQEQKRRRDERLRALLERAAEFYARVLWESEAGAPARDYLASRQLGEAVCREFRLGYAPGGAPLVSARCRRAIPRTRPRGRACEQPR